ncbi:hypothetical protein ACFQH6_08525 [Halobacteriaceae archaeon GCM10025711]
MASQSTGTDRGLGLGVAFTLLAAIGAAVTFTGAGSELGAYGFAAAVALGVLGVAAFHLWG